MLVSKIAWSFRTPTPKYDPTMYPFRTTWAGKSGRWSQIENGVGWVDLADPHALLAPGPVSNFVTVFCNRTRRDMRTAD